MPRPPVLAPLTAAPTAPAFGPFITSPQVRSGAAAFRLFNGAIPPTLSIRDQVAVAVASGRAIPDVSTEDALKRAVLAARSLGLSTGPSGVRDQSRARTRAPMSPPPASHGGGWIGTGAGPWTILIL